MSDASAVGAVLTDRMQQSYPFVQDLAAQLSIGVSAGLWLGTLCAVGECRLFADITKSAQLNFHFSPSLLYYCTTPVVFFVGAPADWPACLPVCPVIARLAACLDARVLSAMPLPGDVL